MRTGAGGHTRGEGEVPGAGGAAGGGRRREGEGRGGGSD